MASTGGTDGFLPRPSNLREDGRRWILRKKNENGTPPDPSKAERQAKLAALEAKPPAERR